VTLRLSRNGIPHVPDSLWGRGYSLGPSPGNELQSLFGRHNEAEWQLQASAPFRTGRFRGLAGTGPDVRPPDGGRGVLWLGPTCGAMHIRGGLKGSTHHLG
jgi:hypothetical protein